MRQGDLVRMNTIPCQKCGKHLYEEYSKIHCGTYAKCSGCGRVAFFVADRLHEVEK